ncbi:hypothetical protein SteCoe_14953 [Stentor coeruleus]|uniref:LITAF domain-containing protein n=1 Tax=Stentor coeruleus TaxID=5963 RepID=A0A1R2C4W0_9CILI|nr:hypothetical protein SteCoe_14953 [Stentor coeruleus]
MSNIVIVGSNTVSYPQVAYYPVSTAVMYPPTIISPSIVPITTGIICNFSIAYSGCPHINTSTSTSYTTSAWIWFIFLFIVCPILSFLPFCLEDCMDRTTYCHDCGRRL